MWILELNLIHGILEIKCAFRFSVWKEMMSFYLRPEGLV